MLITAFKRHNLYVSMAINNYLNQSSLIQITHGRLMAESLRPNFSFMEPITILNRFNFESMQYSFNYNKV